MLLSEFDFPFDSSLIASEPVEPRDQARLLIVDRSADRLTHRRVADLPSLLDPGDLLVANDTKVVTARLTGYKRPGGGQAEMLFVKDLGDGIWEVMLKGKFRPGEVIELNRQARAVVVERSRSRTTVRVETTRPFREVMREIGCMPLPPYIKRAPTVADRVWYQTVFAREEGAVAAPTAGLHFTERLLASLRDRGVTLACVTLHVGPATFKPVTVDRIEDHRMGAEWFDVSVETAELVRRTKAAGGRVVAVGTTVVRALEAAADPEGTVRPFRGETELYIVPGYRFRAVDVLMTNFHLPRTTLLMLVSAFGGLERMRAAYREAINERYRLYSYGDAMLIV